MSDTPTGKVTVRMYDVGFGDCFLLSFGYQPGRDRHVMIDAGCKGKSSTPIKKALKQLAKDCSNELDAVVFTHRHKDHIYVLGVKATAEALLALKPRRILLPWTEDPAAHPKAKQPSRKYTAAERDLVKQLLGLERLGNAMKKKPDKFRRYGYYHDEGEKLWNKDALGRLIQLHRKCKYVKAGARNVLGDVLPGVNCWVLGPPTLTQYPDLKIEVHDKYWSHQYSLTQVRAGEREPDELEELDGLTARRRGAPTTARWFMDRLDHHETLNGMRLVRMMDAAPNNTSLVLLFEVGGKSLLFPGDAEHKLWDFILKSPTNRKRLRNVSVYKVSHHGSGNGTPKAKFWEKLKNLTGNEHDPKRLVTLLSSAPEWFKSIPASSFWKELQKNSKMLSTHSDDKQSAPWDVEL